MPLTLSRRVTFVAKAEYFNSPGIKGWFQQKFFSGAGQVPIDRSGASAAEGAMSAAKRVLDGGDLFGIYPEGTRSHDGKLYRGKTGVARLALETGVPVIPVAVVGTDVVAPPGKKFGTFTRPVVHFGKPLDFSRYEGMENDRYILRSITDEIMYEIMRLSGQEYVDKYSTVAKDEQKKADKESDRADRLSPLRTQRLPDQVVSVRAGVEPHGPVQDTMFRALAVLRFAVLVNAIGIYVVRYYGYDHPLVGAEVMAFMALWTVFVVWAYDDPRRRRPLLLVADLLVAVVAIGLSPYVKGESLQATLPGFWVMGVVLAWAILWRWAGGLAAAVVVSVADLAVRGDFTQQAYGNIFLLVLGGAIVGFLSGLLQETARERDLAERAAASAAERERLARVVHDGVLQALALVQRRAPELGPEGVELGRLAGEQEVQLRALVQQDSLDPAAPRGDQDLALRLSALQTQHVHVAVPGTPATLPA